MVDQTSDESNGNSRPIEIKHENRNDYDLGTTSNDSIDKNHSNSQRRTSSIPPSSPSPSLTIPEPPPQPIYYYKSNADQDMIRTALQKSIYFSCLDDEQMETFVQSVRLQQYQPGQIIITEGCVDQPHENYTMVNDNYIVVSDNHHSPSETNTIDITSPGNSSSSHDVDISDHVYMDPVESSTSPPVMDTVSSPPPSPSPPPPPPLQQQQQQQQPGDDPESSRGVPTDPIRCIETSSTTTQNDDRYDTTIDTSNRIDRCDHPSLPSPLQRNNHHQNNDDEQDDAILQHQNAIHENHHWILSNHPMHSSTKSAGDKTDRYNDDIHITNLESSTSSLSTLCNRTWSSSSRTDPPLPPQSGIPRSIYIIRNGSAQIWYKKTTTTTTTTTTPGNNTDYLVNTIGPGSMFGEGGFLFGRQHSASVIAATTDMTTGSTSTNDDVTKEHANDNGNDDSVPSRSHSSNNNIEPLECWVMDIQTFRQFVLPSTNMRQLFYKFASRHDHNVDAMGPPVSPYVTINDLFEAVNEYQQLDTLQNLCTDDQRNFHLIATLYEALIRLRLIASTTTITTNYSYRQPHTPSTNDSNNETTTKMNLHDFCFFFALLARPDPEVDVIFLLMDEQQTGCIGIHNLQTILHPIYPELDFTSQFFHRYFGVHGDQYIRFKSFSQFLLDLQREIGQQAFCRAIVKGSMKSLDTTDGYLPPNEFVHTLSTSCGWKLPSSVVERLETLYCHKSLKRSGEEHFSFGDFMAFQDVLGNLSFICRLISRAEEFNNGPISADDFKAVNREFGLGERLSRRQVDIIFDLFDVNKDGYISSADIVEICGANFIRNVVPIKVPGNRLAFTAPSPNPSASSERAEEKEYDLLQKIAVGLRNLSVATIVGGISMFLLHPIDLIKTRLMNQRKGSAYLYRGPLDCIQQVIRKEGFMSLFRGVQPHMLGVAIERSIKLQVHNLMQQAFHALDDEKDDDRKPSLLLEALAGGCAGACQLLVTNPMEITSIRLQLYGETARLLKERGIVSPSSSTMVGVIKDLGFPGVYRGASACLIRDVPFSAIFFPSYVACKDVLVQHNSNFTGQATAADIFYAGTIAGIPASLLTTPADVVKCRLQSIARPGEASYSGIRDCVTKMYQNEGIFAFFQGSVMRVLRIAPQFGLSLLLYENLTNLTGLEKCRRPPSNLPIDPVEYSNAFPSLHDTEPGFLKRWFQSTFHREQ